MKVSEAFWPEFVYLAFVSCTPSLGMAPKKGQKVSASTASPDPGEVAGAETGIGALISTLAKPSSSHTPTEADNTKNMCVLPYDFLRADTR